MVCQNRIFRPAIGIRVRCSRMIRSYVDVRIPECHNDAPACQHILAPRRIKLGLQRAAEYGSASGYCPGGAIEYIKSFAVPEDYRSKRITFQFEGVYRDAMVFINGEFAAQRPCRRQSRRVRHEVRQLLPGESAVVRQRLYVNAPALWNVESPNLYAVAAAVRTSARMLAAEQTRFGIRTLQLDPKHSMRINGKTVKLRGACIHHDNGILGARRSAAQRSDGFSC